jgi:hypothetical protein
MWVELPELDRYVIARIAKRVRATLDGNGSKYLEHGLPA